MTLTNVILPIRVKAWSNAQQVYRVFSIQVPYAIANVAGLEAQSKRLRNAFGGDWIVVEFLR